jgi:hypothetical protein
MGAVTAVWPQETEPREGTNTGNPAGATFIPTNLDQGRGDSPPRHHLARHPRHHLAQTTLSPLLEPSFETCITILTIRVRPDERPRRRSCFSRYAAHVANLDRHGDLQQRHTPSLEEARAVVQLAVAIVHWDGTVRSLRMIMRRSGQDCAGYRANRAAKCR